MADRVIAGRTLSVPAVQMAVISNCSGRQDLSLRQSAVTSNHNYDVQPHTLHKLTSLIPFLESAGPVLLPYTVQTQTRQISHNTKCPISVARD
jgi:hypothetical protein